MFLKHGYNLIKYILYIWERNTRHCKHFVVTTNTVHVHCQSTLRTDQTFHTDLILKVILVIVLEFVHHSQHDRLLPRQQQSLTTALININAAVI